MVAAGNEMPLPAPKPAAIEVAKQDGKGKAEPAGARAATDGRSLAAPKAKAVEAKTEIAALEAKKQVGKGKAEPAGSARDGRPADAAFAGAENEDPRDRNQETGRQGQGGVRQLRRERIGQAYAVACSGNRRPGDRSQEAGRQSQSGVRHPRRERDRPADAVAGAEIEDPGIEIKKQDDKGSGVRQRRPDCGWRQAKGSRPSRLGIRALTISVTRPMAVSGSSVCTTSKSENPAGGKRGFQIRLLGVRGELGQPPRAPVSTARLFQAYFLAKNLVSRFAAESRPAFRSLWLESGTHGDIIEPQLEPVISGRRSSGIAADAHIPLDGAPSSANSCQFFDSPRSSAMSRISSMQYLIRSKKRWLAATGLRSGGALAGQAACLESRFISRITSSR